MSAEIISNNKYAYSQSFIDAFNMADQPIDSDEKKIKFLELIESFTSNQFHQLFIDSNHQDATQILFDKYSFISNNPKNVINAIVVARKKNLKGKLSYLYGIIDDYKKKSVYDDYFSGCLIKTNNCKTYIEVYDKLVIFLEKYHKTIDSLVRSSYWHDHKFKYPFENIKVCMLVNYENEVSGVSLVAFLNETYTEDRNIFMNSYVSNKINDDPDEIVYQNLVVYQLAKYSFTYKEWLIKYISIKDNDIKVIKCAKCRKIINDPDLYPFLKKIHKYIPPANEKCQECLALEEPKINPDNYYCDWTPAHYEKWYIPGKHFIFKVDNGYPPEILKTSQPVVVSNFILKNIINIASNASTETKLV